LVGDDHPGEKKEELKFSKVRIQTASSLGTPHRSADQGENIHIRRWGLSFFGKGSPRKGTMGILEEDTRRTDEKGVSAVSRGEI